VIIIKTPSVTRHRFPINDIKADDQIFATMPSPAYTAKEKEWLKRHWDGEFKFLAAYGLSIYDEDDREEGRAIARAMIAQDEA
jgi:hypothetical protein